MYTCNWLQIARRPRLHILFLDVQFFLSLHGMGEGGCGVAEILVVHLIPLAMLRRKICQLFGGSMGCVQLNAVYLEMGSRERQGD